MKGLSGEGTGAVAVLEREERRDEEEGGRRAVGRWRGCKERQRKEKKKLS